MPPIVAKASGWLSDAASLADLAQGSTVNLAVTGLSRSGKTVFITSLIHNLLSAVHNPNRMPLLGVVGERPADRHAAGERRRQAGCRASATRRTSRRWRRARRSGRRAPTTCARSASRSASCRRTRPASCSARSAAARRRSRSGSSTIPASGCSTCRCWRNRFAEWSRATLRLYRRGVRAEAASEFLAFIAQHRHDETASDETAKQAHDLYRAFLVKARDVHGLSHLQPGRFLCPGKLADAPFLWFAPLDVPDNAHIGAEHARRADGGALRHLQARGGRALLRGSLPLVLAADRAGRRAARAARRPRGVRGPAARARGDPAKLPLRLRQPVLETDLGPAHRQGAVRRHQGRSRARYVSAIIWRSCCATWRRFRRSRPRARARAST